MLDNYFRETSARNRDPVLRENKTSFDFDEKFSDDEDIVLGIEDQDDDKEAKSRIYGQESGVKISKTAKLFAKGLKKYDGFDLDLEEENPYWSEMEEDDEDGDNVSKNDDEQKAQQRVLELLKKDISKTKKKGGISTPPSQTNSPMLKREASVDSDEEQARKRSKVIYPNNCRTTMSRRHQVQLRS